MMMFDWFLSDSWVASFWGPAQLSIASSTIKQWKAGRGLGTRLTPEYNYKKDTTDQSLPTWLAPPVAILTLYTRASWFYTLIMFKMSWSQGWAKPWEIDKVGDAEREMSGESRNSNTCEDLDLTVLVDMQLLGTLLLSLQTLLHTMKISSPCWWGSHWLHAWSVSWQSPHFPSWPPSWGLSPETPEIKWQ